MASRPAFELDTKTIGALPLVNHFLGRLRLEHFLRTHLSPPDPRSKLPPLSALGVIVRNLVLARTPGIRKTPSSCNVSTHCQYPSCT